MREFVLALENLAPAKLEEQMDLLLLLTEF